tara:strand:- start:1864 stop:3012 length:1149 start_codon:yes stop_codon:yes gene_type:complete
MPRVVICGVARTPIGKFRGSLSEISAVELGIRAVKELLRRCSIDPSSGVIGEVLFGQVLQTGSGQAPARQVALGAGLPISIAATTINKVCGSSLKAVMMAANSIKAGEYNAIIAGGMESMTNAPKFEKKTQGGKEMTSSMVHDGLWDVYNDVHMGNTGEIIANECSITREMMDSFAAQSQQRAMTAEQKGWFDWERFNMPELERDEGIRGETSPEKLSELKPVFQEDGTITAGNSSTLNDGASAVLIANEDFAKEQGWEIIAIVEDYCTAGVEPERVMYAPIPAINTLLERANMQVLDIDIYEHNEAFASASCAIAKEIGIPTDRFNLHGGAVALGHPLGSSGTRCLITLLGVMRRKRAKSGIVTLCLGGGNAVALRVSMNN